MSQYNRRPDAKFDKAERLPTNIIVLLIALVILLIGGGIGLGYLFISGQMTARIEATASTATAFAAATARMKAASTATAASNATETANVNATQIAITASTATAQANAQATATATTQTNAQATATASAIASNLNPYPPGRGTLALNDALRDNSKGNNWDTNATNCAFTGGTYHVSAPNISSLATCTARSTNFSNFAYEVQMTIIKGDTGGILFRANATNNTSYIFYVSQAGRYELVLCPGTTCHDIIRTAPSPAIIQGLNKPNLLAVVALGNTLTLYVNHQQVGQVTDSTLSQGQIGLVASAFATAGHPTEVMYSNVRVWML
jgi:flagellar basal body-associated protein FliL